MMIWRSHCLRGMLLSIRKQLRPQIHPLLYVEEVDVFPEQAAMPGQTHCGRSKISPGDLVTAVVAFKHHSELHGSLPRRLAAATREANAAEVFDEQRADKS